MLHHDLMEGDRIKHFSIYDAPNNVDIHKELVHWIRKEDIRIRTNWEILPCTKRFGYGHFVLGYHKLFRYQQYEFRLILDTECVDMYCCCEQDRGECIDCDRDPDAETIHFELLMESNQKFVCDPIKQPVHYPELPDEFQMIPSEPILEWDEYPPQSGVYRP